MSLFGEDDDFAPRPKANKSSGLFEDETANRSSNSLFADDDTNGATSNSPWAMPTPKKGARDSLVKNLLRDVEVPESYVDAFDKLVESGNTASGGVSVQGVQTLISEAILSTSAKGHILSLIGVADNQSKGVGRGEFNVLMALVGLAQEEEEVTLDSVDERRRKLPQPNLGNFANKIARQSAEPKTPSTESPEGVSQAPSQSTPSPTKSRTMRKPSFGLDSDPWASPEMHKDHSHSTAPVAPQTNGTSSHGVSSMPPRTTSTFTTSAASDQPDRDRSGAMNSSTGDSGGWDNFNPAPGEQFRDSGLGGEGFGAPSGGDGGGNGPGGLSQSMGASRTVNNGVEEVITVTSIPEKEGMFMFQHRNYEVTSPRRNSKVIRRYSDFVWLLDCLHKRFPFRQLPLLPPKRVASKWIGMSARKPSLTTSS